MALAPHHQVTSNGVNKKHLKCSRIGNILLYLYKKKKKVRVIAKKTLKEFWEDHNDCEQQLKSWYEEASGASWKTPNDIKRDYPSASVLEDNRVVFNIKGNNYRLIVKINYRFGMVWIRFIGTHVEYDQVDAKTI